MRKNNGKKAKITVIALTLVACLMVAGVSAYFTDADTATNTFTVGNVSLDLQEPNWNPPTDITPNEEFAKDPQIKNDGINEEYVFMEVIVPYANVVTANADGSKNAAAKTELFTYTVNEGWVLLGHRDADGNVSDEVVYNDDGTVTHLYAYAADDTMTALTAGTTTPALFNYIKFANVVEGEGLEESTQHVVVNAYGIQTKNITDATLNGQDDGIDTPAEVWSVVSTQAPSTAMNSGVTEETYTDKKN